MTADGRWDLTWRLKCSTRKCRLQPCNENYVLFSKVNLPTLLSFKYTVVPKRRTVPQYCLRAVLFSTHELRMTFLTLSSDSRPHPPPGIFSDDQRSGLSVICNVTDVISSEFMRCDLRRIRSVYRVRGILDLS